MTTPRRLLLIGLLWAACAQASAADDFITIPSGLSQTLVIQKGGGYSVRMGITPAPDVSLDDLTPKVFEVQFKDGRSTATASDFLAKFTKETDKLGPALTISVPAAAAEVVPGNYVVTVRVTSRKEVAATKPPSPSKVQSLVLALTRPAPTLSVGPTIYIERTAWFTAADDVIKGNLRLTEESRNSNITGLTLTAEADQKPDSRIVGGALELPAGPLDLSAGDSATHEIGVKGDFPPGTYTGKITVRSPDLPGVASINYEVRSRRSSGWLVLLALAGAAIGLLTRVYLKNRQEFADAETAASLVLEKLNLTYDRIQDEEIRAKLDTARVDLKTAAASGKASDLAAQTRITLDLLPTLETAFKAKWDAFQAKLAPLTTLLDKKWALPAPIQPSFDKILATRGLIAAALARNDITQAEQPMSAIPGALLDTVLESIKWRVGLDSYLSTLDTNMPALNDADAKKVHTFAEGIREKIPPEKHPVMADVAIADAELTQTHSANAGMKDFAASFPAASSDFFERARESFADASEEAPNEWAAVDATTRSVVGNVTAEPVDFDSRIPQLTERLRAQLEAWRRLLARLVKPDQFSKVETLLDSRSWDTVITTAKKSLISETQFNAAVGATAESQPPPSQLQTPDLSRTPDPAAGTLKDTPWRPFALTGSESERRALRRQSNWAALCQTAVVTALFVAGVYALNADTWIGTPKEMLSLFLLAFSVDLTADGVMAALKK